MCVHVCVRVRACVRSWGNACEEKIERKPSSKMEEKNGKREEEGLGSTSNNEK